MRRAFVHPRSRPAVNNDNDTRNQIQGDGNTVNTVNQNWNIFGAEPYANPSAIIERALGKYHVRGAVFKAQTETGCMSGTRVQILSDVFGILKTATGPRIVWVTGMVGTGKTSIALTLCQQLGTDTSVCLGGAFFCSRSVGSLERTDLRRIIPTLATTLARQFPDYSTALADQLESEPEIEHHTIRTQVEILLNLPLRKLGPLGGQIVFVIDALDECSDRGQIAELLDTLTGFNEDAPVKFLFTSRPEMHIRDSTISNRRYTSIFHLHTIDPNQVTEDIRMYVSKTLERVSPLDTWYTSGDIKALTNLSAGLFLVAASALKYICGLDTIKGRQTRLREVTSAAEARDPVITPVDRIYELILTKTLESDNMNDADQAVMWRVLACILAARAPISVHSLADLMSIGAADLRGSLEGLHSVLYLPPSNDEVGVQVIHASFGEYLFDRARSRLRIAPSLGDEILSRGCLQVMAKRLQFNISQSHTSWDPNRPTQRESITLSLEYACLQWIYHIDNLRQPGVLDSMLTKVLRSGLLFWLEVLSVLGHVRHGAAMLMFAATTVQDAGLCRFMRDANHFVASSHEAIERSASHIYLSALPFSSKDSLVYKDFSQLCGRGISVQTQGIERHGEGLVMTFTSHEGLAEALTPSPNGRFLVSVSRNGTILKWDLRTQQTDSGRPRSIVFAADSKSIAIATESGVVHVLSVESVAESSQIHQLREHTDAVLSVVFFPGAI